MIRKISSLLNSSQGGNQQSGDLATGAAPGFPNKHFRHPDPARYAAAIVRVSIILDEESGGICDGAAAGLAGFGARDSLLKVFAQISNIASHGRFYHFLRRCKEFRSCSWRAHRVLSFATKSDGGREKYLAVRSGEERTLKKRTAARMIRKTMTIK